MVDRFLVWLSAGVVTAGVSAAMVVGAGIAAAETGSPGSDAKGTTSAESTKPTENKADSDTDGVGKPKTKPSGEKPKKDAAADPKGPDETDATPQDDEDKTADETEPPAQQADEQPTAATTKDAEPAGSDTAEKLADQPVKPAAIERKPAAKPAAKQEVEEPTPTGIHGIHGDDRGARRGHRRADVAQWQDRGHIQDRRSSDRCGRVRRTGQRGDHLHSGGAATIRSAQCDRDHRVQPVRLRDQIDRRPPDPSPNSTVTVHSSTLRIDCADGYEVPADWYIPAGAEENPPQRLIYLQHGFLASGPWYSHTAATLAEQTNSIVVAPSITSNFLSCDACWLGAPPMQQAVANLFEDDNTALADSALAAGYTGPIPDRVVLVGHSLGGGLVAGTAGYMVDNDTVDRLAGVVMLDGVGLDGSMTTSLEKVPDEIPIYQLAAPEYFWNQFGVGSHALLEARPDRFVGVTLVGGSHVDSMQGGNPLIQFSQELVAGFTMPENVAAAKILMVGWINDMFAGTQEDGIYADPSEESRSTPLRDRPPR